ncbi:MAG: hypothetical protein GXO94_08480, partial [Nitrospirae bacterium]|nr:hypothetical protein [Nitrospirota bacterium]
AAGRLEYINKALYFVVIPADKRLSYCSGVNIRRFLPITRGRHKAMSNPAVRGLQIVNHEIRSMAIEAGAAPRTTPLMECRGIAPTADIWYTESLLIDNPPEGFGERIISHAVITLLKKIDKAIMLKTSMPEHLLPPAQLEEFIEELCRKFGT